MHFLFIYMYVLKCCFSCLFRLILTLKSKQVLLRSVDTPFNSFLFSLLFLESSVVKVVCFFSVFWENMIYHSSSCIAFYFQGRGLSDVFMCIFLILWLDIGLLFFFFFKDVYSKFLLALANYFLLPKFSVGMCALERGSAERTLVWCSCEDIFKYHVFYCHLSNIFLLVFVNLFI